MLNYKRPAILLINTGSPQSPGLLDVASYLSCFLGNSRIIEMPTIFRKVLVNGLILSIRSPQSAKRYRQLWSIYNGVFPLVKYGIEVQNQLQKARPECDIYLGMCFDRKGFKQTLQAIEQAQHQQLTILPLFPHYASSSTGVALEMVLQHVCKWKVIPEIKTINQFYDHPLFINAFAQRLFDSKPNNYQHIVFTYHSLPNSHVAAACAQKTKEPCTQCATKAIIGSCYPAACYKTSQLIAQKVGLAAHQYSTCFQSQLNNQWQQPFADQLIPQLAQQGVERILLVAPSFVADCLETTIELGIEYQQLFLKAGGKQLDLVESLNDSPLWIETLSQLIGN